MFSWMSGMRAQLYHCCLGQPGSCEVYFKPGKIDEVAKEFSEASTNEAKMKVTAKCYNLAHPDNNMEKNFRQVRTKTNFKSQEMAKQFLMEGDKAVSLKMALELYTNAISYAPLDSGELALGYYKRGRALYLLGRCRASLEDIKRAWSHEHAPKNKRALMMYEMKCHQDLGNMKEAHICLKKAFSYLEHFCPGLTAEKIAAEKQRFHSQLLAPARRLPCDENIIFPEKVPDLSYGPSSEILGASSAVGMEWNEQLGNHLVANRDINIGDVLLIGENVISAVRASHIHDHCSHCFKLCYNSLPCQNCALMVFCSEHCRSAANKKYHLNECAAFSRFFHTKNNSSISFEYSLVFRLLATIGINNIQPYLKYARANTKDNPTNILDSSDGLFDSSDIESIFKMDSMLEKRDQRNVLKYSLYSLLLPRCFGMTCDHPDFFAVAGLCLQLYNTALVIHDTKTYSYFNINEIRQADPVVYFNPLGSLKKHACHCNLHVIPYGNKLVSIAKWPVSEGSVLTECYDIYSLLKGNKQSRQSILKWKLFLDCKCEACENDWDFDSYIECITDQDDVQEILKLLVSYKDEVYELFHRNLPPNLASAKFETFLNPASDILTKLHSKGEFRDYWCAEISSLLLTYYSMQGNRTGNPVSVLKAYHMQSSDCGPNTSAGQP